MAVSNLVQADVRLMGGESVRMRCRHLRMLVRMLTPGKENLRMAEEENTEEVDHTCTDSHD